MHYHRWHLKNLKALKDLHISSLVVVDYWGSFISQLEILFKGEIGRTDEWVFPEMRIVEKLSGLEINPQNWEAILLQEKKRWCRKHGAELDPDWKNYVDRD